MIESLIAIVILALVAIAAFVGLQTSLTSAERHEESAVADGVLRSAAEQLQSSEQQYLVGAGCAAATYALTVPTEFDGYTIDVAVSFWQPPDLGWDPDAADFDPSVDPPSLVTFDNDDFAGPETPCPSDAGLQRVDLTVTAPSGATEQLSILKRMDS